MSDLKITLTHESPGDAEAVEQLNDRAFGPGRFARSAERVREASPPDLRVSFVARVATLLVGSLRQSPIRIGTVPALMLGPLAVEPAFRSRGIGRQLIERGLVEARTLGYRCVLLVGDEPYYGRLGFRRVPPGRIMMPGPVDPGRVLLYASDEEVRTQAAGPVRPA